MSTLFEKESSWKHSPACQHHHQSAIGIGLHGLPLSGNVIRRLPTRAGDNRSLHQVHPGHPHQESHSKNHGWSTVQQLQCTLWIPQATSFQGANFLGEKSSRSFVKWLELKSPGHLSTIQWEMVWLNGSAEHYSACLEPENHWHKYVAPEIRSQSRIAMPIQSTEEASRVASKYRKFVMACHVDRPVERDDHFSVRLSQIWGCTW